MRRGQWPAIRILVFLDLIELVFDASTQRKLSFFGVLSGKTKHFFFFLKGPQVTYLIRKEFKAVKLDLDVDALCGKMTIQWELLWLPKVPFLGWSAFSSY